MLLSLELGTKISSICECQQCHIESHSGDVHEVVVFFILKVEEAVENMLHLFFIMADKSKPSIFIDLWEKGKRMYLHHCEQAPSLPLPEVATQIWTP